MKLFLTLTFLSFQFIDCCAQWQKIGSGTTKDLYDIQMKGRYGYAAGQNSTILKSTDSGKSWKSVALTISSDLKALYFTDTTTGFVTGENARIQKTTDGGKTWSQKYARTATYAYSITLNGKWGISVGQDLLAVRSDNFGESWTVDTTFQSTKQLNSAVILPGGMCWAVGDSGYILKKHVSQKRWTLVQNTSAVNLNYITNIGDSVLIATGGMHDSDNVGTYYSILLRSTDSGKTWASMTIPEMKIIQAGWFFNKDSGFLAGGSGVILRCLDPAVKRNRLNSGTLSTLNKLFFYRSVGFAVGDGGTILRTVNSGGFGVGIQKFNMGTISIYPNPGQGAVKVDTDQVVQSVRVTDISGREIHYTMEGNMIRLDAKGLFIIRVELANGNVLTRQFIMN